MSTATATRENPLFSRTVRRLPAHILDQIADRERDKGFDCRRSNTCGRCYEVRSRNGSCMCA